MTTKPKTGKEKLSDNGEDTQYDLLDFWRWSASDILSNALRGVFAEFVVGTALGLNLTQIRKEWDNFDLVSSTQMKIEVKSAAYIQAWQQKGYSEISFSIAPSQGYDEISGKRAQEAKRQADIYVFCLLKHKDRNTIDPLKMEQWEFYVVPTALLNAKHPEQKTVRLNPLKKLTPAISYAGLCNAIALC